jgi:two-component system response regulator YesN
MVIEFMNANLDRKLSLSELASSVNISCSPLCYLFNSQVGMSPGHYFLMLKMQKAAELLTTSPSVSVKQIMAMVRYDDKSHFVRNFKRAYALTPSQYRAKHLDLMLSKDHPGASKS